MNTGKETWKWALVVLLLAVFLITANQAYEHLANQEDYEPPDDYKKGDSWDLEHQTGPGSGQPVEIKNGNSNKITSGKNQPVKINERLSTPKTIVFDDDSKWNQSKNESNQPSAEPVKDIIKESLKKSEAEPQKEVKETQPPKTTEPTSDTSSTDNASKEPEQASENKATDIVPNQAENTNVNNLPENDTKQIEPTTETVVQEEKPATPQPEVVPETAQ